MARNWKNSLLKDRVAHVLAVMEEEQGWEHPQVELARAMKTGQNNLQHWLSGRNLTMKSRYAWPLQDKYRWNARWVLDGEGPERIPAPDPEKDKILEDIRRLSVERLKAIKSVVSP